MIARLRRIEKAAARAAAAAERIDGGLAAAEDRVAGEVGEAASRSEKALQTTCNHVDLKSRLVHKAVEELRTIVAGPRFGPKTVLVGLIVFVLGMLFESRAPVFYHLVWSG